MCSFLIFNWLIQNIEYINHHLKFRGPDKTNILNYNDFTFLHNLLHLTGQITIQPFVNEKHNIVALFNGEIYNYLEFGDYNSDGECIIDVYLKYGKSFVQKFDGEFAIVLFDFKKDIFFISTDVFATKPIWYSIEDGKLGLSTYESGLKRAGLKNIVKLNPNTTLEISISSLDIISEQRVFKFTFSQYKKNYDDWCKAFINSIKKRSTNDNYPLFVCLSSGYDSGAICCALNLLGIKYDTYTILGKENEDIINERININKSHNDTYIPTTVTLTLDEFVNIHKDVKRDTEYFKYLTSQKSVQNDKASVGMMKICRFANKRKQRIFLSGSGADEIHSDYGFRGRKIYNHSCFGGFWPSNLETIITNNPSNNNVWHSFYHGTQRDYLAKEEIISGHNGIEGRYPFLDKYVVQEFLSLHPNLKNITYKAPLDYFMTKHNYPFEKGVKKGFNPI